MVVRNLSEIEESFNPCEEKETIEEGKRSRPSIPGNLGIVGEMNLYYEMNWGKDNDNMIHLIFVVSVIDRENFYFLNENRLITYN